MIGGMFMTVEQASEVIDKLSSIIWLLNNLKVIGLFCIGCAAALLVLFIIWRCLIYFIQKF